MYKALYRKWRPKTFDDLIGQPHITETLKGQLINDRLSHAYLFIGTRGTGKTSSAKILAKAVNCEDLQEGNPCNLCPACLGIEDGSILDVEELDAASNNGVDHVRALRDEAVFSPTVLKKRVYIIDEVHMLSIAAFNALLKILEEPPAHLLFILATTEAHKVPATILSRCQRYHFRRVPASDIALRLKAVSGWENLNLTNGAATLLANLAEGSMRDALALLDQCSAKETIDEETVRQFVGLTGKEDVCALLTRIGEQNTPLALEKLNELYYAGKGMESLLNELSVLLRDILLVKLSEKGSANLLSGNFDEKTLLGFSHFSQEMLMQALGIVTDASFDLSRHTNRKLMVELCLVRLCEPKLSGDTEALAARIARLETMLENGVAVPTGTVAVAKAPVPPPQEKAAEHFPKEEEEMFFSDRDAPPIIEADSPPWIEEKEIPAKPQVSPVEAAPVAIAPMKTVEKVEETAPMVGTEDLWGRVLSAIKEKIDIGVFMLIGDKNEVKAVLEQSVFHIYAESEFTKIMLEDKAVQSAIQEEISNISGQGIRVQTHLGAPVVNQGVNKLDALADKAKNLGILQ